jgi:hypothetical protein
MALIDLQNKINEMYRKIPDIAAQMSEVIQQLTDYKIDLGEQIDAVEGAVCDVAESELDEYLYLTKLPEIRALWPVIPGIRGQVIQFDGPNYGSIDYGSGGLTDWDFRQYNYEIIPPAIVPVPAYWIRYKYQGTGWDGDTIIEGYINDFAYGNDLLTKPLDTDGTYGLYESKDQVQQGIDVIDANKTATEAGEAVFAKYKP